LSVGVRVEIHAGIGGAIDVFGRDASQLGEYGGRKRQAGDQQVRKDAQFSSSSS
jgi:hypothetical protein